MLKLKEIRSGEYITIDGRFIIFIDIYDGFWYACDAVTGQSVGDPERTMREIKESLSAYIEKHN